MRNRSNAVTVGLGHIQVTKEPGAVLRAMALGSCVGVVVVAPRYRAIGMAHIVLPDSKIDPNRALELPGYFADTGIDEMLDQFRKMGVHNHRDLMIRLAGGASVVKASSNFDIGKRNILAVRKHLWRNRLAPIAEDVGASISRTVWVSSETGKVFIESPGRGRWEI